MPVVAASVSMESLHGPSSSQHGQQLSSTGSRFNRLLSKLAASSSSSSIASSSRSPPSSTSPAPSRHSPASSQPPALRASMDPVATTSSSSSLHSPSNGTAVPSTPVRYAPSLDLVNNNNNNPANVMMQTPAQHRVHLTSSGTTAILPDIDEMTPLRPPVFESRFMRELAANNNNSDTAAAPAAGLHQARLYTQMYGSGSVSTSGDVTDTNRGGLSPPSTTVSHSRSSSATSLLSRKSSNRSSGSNHSYQQHHGAAPSISYASAAVIAAYSSASTSSTYTQHQHQLLHHGSIPSRSGESKRHSPPPAPSSGMAQRSLPRLGSSTDLSHNQYSAAADFRTTTSYDTSPAGSGSLHRKTTSLALSHRIDAAASAQQSPKPSGLDNSALASRNVSPQSHDEGRSVEMLRSHSSLGFYAASAQADKLEAKLYGSPRHALHAKDANVFATPGISIQARDAQVGSGSKFSNFAKSATNAFGNLTRKRSNDALNTFASSGPGTSAVDDNRETRPNLFHRAHSDNIAIAHDQIPEKHTTDVDVPIVDQRSHNAYSHDKATPGYPRVGLSTIGNASAPLTAGLSESSKRFRSAFRMNKNRSEHLSSQGQPGITPGLGSRRAMRVHRENKAEDTDEDEGHVQLTASAVLQSDSDRSPDDIRPSIQSTDDNDSSAAQSSSNLSPPYWGSTTSQCSNDAAEAMQARYENAALAAEPKKRSEMASVTYQRPSTALGLVPINALQSGSSHGQAEYVNRSERLASAMTVSNEPSNDSARSTNRAPYERGMMASSSTSSLNNTLGMDSDTLVADPPASKAQRPTTNRTDRARDSDEEVEVIRMAPNTDKENIDPVQSGFVVGSRTQALGNGSISSNRPVLGQLRRPLQQHQLQPQSDSLAFPSSQSERSGKAPVALSSIDAVLPRASKGSISSVNPGYHPIDRQIVVMSDYAVPTKAGGDTPPDQRHSNLLSAAQSTVPVAHALPVQVGLPQEISVAPRKTVGTVTVKGKTYTRMGLLGRGGSSKVFRVSDRDHQIYALKKVDLGKGADSETYQAFLNEIDLLERLQGHDRIIQLVASEVNEARRSLIMVMEIGEIDLNALLQERQGKRVSMNFIRHTWEQMLEAVNVIHEVGIVHTDLKPANFVLVKGALKLIDFGIAKAIPNDTTNIARDQQIGTANYMSPEALSPHFSHGPRGERIMKLGRPSDVWSLGCILFQIVYGHTPFGRIKNLAAKMAAIQTPGYQIEFAEVTVPLTIKGEPLPDLAVPVESDLLRCVKSCLRYDPKKRITIPQLLEDPFLRAPAASSSPPPPETATPFDPQIIAQVIGKTLQWSRGREPDRIEQERFMEAIMRQLHARSR